MSCETYRTSISRRLLGHKMAFTMAEVLVTLGIIGVVAAMTLPGVAASHRSKALEALFKKRYSELSQVLLVFQDTEEYIYGLHTAPQLQDMLVKHFKGAKAPDRAMYLKNADYQKRYLGYSLPVYKNYSRTAEFNKARLDDGFIAVNKGFFIYFNADGFSTKNIYVIIDINGLQKPNVIGYDVFVFKLDRANTLNVLNQNTGLCSRTSNSDFNGWNCSYEAMNDGNYFKNLGW